MQHVWLSKNKFNNIFGLILLGIIFFCLNIVSNKFLQGVGIDFTENKLYSISAPSKKILSQVQRPVVIRLYLSKKLAKTYPYLLNYAARVEELLKSYQKNSHHKITLELIELGPFSGKESQALQDGVLGIPVDGTTEELFFGLVVKSGDKKDIIPFIEPSKESTLEHSISSLIAQVAMLNTDIIPILEQIQVRAEYSRPFVKLAEMQLFSQAKYQVRSDALNQRLVQLNAVLAEINLKKTSSKPELRDQAAAEENVVKLELTVTKQELVELKKDLNNATAELERNIKIAATGFVPLLIILFMLLTWFYHSKIASKHSSAWTRLLRQYNGS